MEQATFGHWLRQRRRILDLTQSELARRAGCSEVTVRKIEGAERMPSATLAQTLAMCLNHVDNERAAPNSFLPSQRSVVPARATATQAPVDPLAVPLTPMLGRDGEAAQILERLLDPYTRLLTLTGPPGIGKTRLALHIADRVQARADRDVCVVALASLHDPALVPELLARELRLTRSGEAPLAALGRALRERRMLLVLDNFEQVVAAAPRIVELLRMAPRVTALVTSRSALRVMGEYVYPVPPLAQPEPPGGDEPPLEVYARAPAVQLFVERARAIRPDWTLSQDNAPDVAAICARLDGLPLAIELAAARMRLFTPRALASRLGGSNALSLLVKGQHDLPAHERTLRGAIDWSYRLLGPDERALFARLGVFSGGFTPTAAAAVAGLPGEAQRAPAMLDTIVALANQSLLHAEARDDGELRMSMLATIREYALSKLAADGALEATRRRHAAYFAALAGHAALQLGGTAQAHWLDQLQAECHNLRSALEWFVEHDAPAGLRCAANLSRFWHVRGMLSEGRDWLGRLLAAAQRRPAADRRAVKARAQALLAAGVLAEQQGDHQHAQEASGASLELYRALGAQDGAVASLINLGRVALGQGDYRRAGAIYDECLALYQALGDATGTANTLRERALIAKDQGALEQAQQLQEQALEHYRRLGDTHGVTKLLYDLSVTAYWKTEYGRAGGLAEQAAALCRTLGNQVGLAYALECIGMVAHHQGRPAEAAHTLAQSLRLFRSLDEKAGIALVLDELGLLALTQGDAGRAAQYHRDGLALAWRIGDRRRVCFCLEGYAAAVAPQRPLHAARLCGAAAALRLALGTPLLERERPAYQPILAAARAEAGVAAFEAACKAGQALEPADAVDEALGRAA